MSRAQKRRRRWSHHPHPTSKLVAGGHILHLPAPSARSSRSRGSASMVRVWAPQPVPPTRSSWSRGSASTVRTWALRRRPCRPCVRTGAAPCPAEAAAARNIHGQVRLLFEYSRGQKGSCPDGIMECNIPILLNPNFNPCMVHYIRIYSFTCIPYVYADDL
uniref:Uncharacterized protein n=1 Tax=Oryza barthii TaxID=65489 RepID=A0A0D3G690_9ORYZ